MKILIKKILTGLTIPQEYVCLKSPGYESSLTVFLHTKNVAIAIDVTHSHLFLGYKPLLLAIPLRPTDLSYQEIKNQNEVSLTFDNTGELKPRHLAKLVLGKIETRVAGDRVVVFFTGKQGAHQFINPAHQWMNNLREKWRKHTPNNISLPGNLLDQVRIAYSVPRVISVITTSDGSAVNIFPTDLHGPVENNFYISSLRKGGKACSQVEQYKKIVISEVDSSQFQSAYQLGKNHMKEMREKENFDLSSEVSHEFGYSLPKGTGRYRELEVIEYFDVGIHRVFIYRIVYFSNLGDIQTLTHIHQFYAQWREDHHLKTDFLIR